VQALIAFALETTVYPPSVHIISLLCPFAHHTPPQSDIFQAGAILADLLTVGATCGAEDAADAFALPVPPAGQQYTEAWYEGVVARRRGRVEALLEAADVAPDFMDLIRWGGWLAGANCPWECTGWLGLG
jgi:hypothetical protein